MRPDVQPRGEPFFLTLAILQLAVVVAGFAPTYYARPATLPPLAPEFLWHGRILTVWYLLVVVQSGLIGLRRDRTTLRLHKHLGLASVGIAALVIYSGIGVAFEFYRGGSATEILSPAGILTANLMNLLGFAICFSAGIAYRTRRELHKRYMVLAGVVMIGPAAFRLTVNCSLPPPLSLAVQLGFVVAMFAYDRAKLGRISAPNWVAVGLILSLITATLLVG